MTAMLLSDALSGGAMPCGWPRPRGLCREERLRSPSRRSLIASTVGCSFLFLRLYQDPPAILDVDVQVVPVQQRHPDEGRRI